MPVDRIVKFSYKAVVEAKVCVNKVRPKWLNWEREWGDDDDEVSLFVYLAILCICAIVSSSDAMEYALMIRMMVYGAAAFSWASRRNISRPGSTGA